MPGPAYCEPWRRSRDRRLRGQLGHACVAIAMGPANAAEIDLREKLIGPVRRPWTV